MDSVETSVNNNNDDEDDKNFRKKILKLFKAMICEFSLWRQCMRNKKF